MRSMSQPPQPQQPANLNINMPPEQMVGHYADFVSIWHNAETFILDFVSVGSPPVPMPGLDGQTVPTLQCQIVSRVRIPPSQVWEIMKGLQNQLGLWENEHPDRKPPQPEI